MQAEFFAIFPRLRLEADALRAALRGGPREGASERFLFVLSKRNPSDSKEKTALVRVDT